jgi:hypothetical protein
MIELSSQVANNGFIFNSLSQIIERNNYPVNFRTLNFNSIILTIDDLEISSIRLKGTTLFVGPQKN